MAIQNTLLHICEQGLHEHGHLQIPAPGKGVDYPGTPSEWSEDDARNNGHPCKSSPGKPGHSSKRLTPCNQENKQDTRSHGNTTPGYSRQATDSEGGGGSGGSGVSGGSDGSDNDSLLSSNKSDDPSEHTEESH